MVYFLTVGSPISAVKIGMLAVTDKTDLRSAVVRRLSNIQSANHELVSVYGLVHLTDGDYPTKAAEDLERQLHSEFESLSRFEPGTRGAEWFDVSEELLAKIDRISVKPESLGLPGSVGKPIRSGCDGP